MGGGGSGIACPGFSVLRFRREFLSRMRIPKGNRTRRSGLARFGMDADRGRPQPMITCAILLRNPQPKANTPFGAFTSRVSRQIYVQARLLDSLPAEKSTRKTGTGNPAAAAPQKTPSRASAHQHSLSG